MKTCPQCEHGYADSHTTCPTHGLLLNEIRDLKPGLIIRSSYRIEGKLGKGGMGVVYKAEQLNMKELRALKFLSPDYADDEQFRGRFLREVKALRQLHHPNVIACGDLERAEDDSWFFAMDYAEGGSLHDWMKKWNPGQMPVVETLEIAKAVAEGLGAAHGKGLVHRDIKPDNILMAWEEDDGGKWVPRIADFGIVAMRGPLRTSTGDGRLTMPYAAPEQWKGMRGAELDGRADLYALGCVLFEILTGQLLFDAESYHEWSIKHQTEIPRKPSSLRQELTRWKGLDSLVMQMLAKEPQQRPPSAADVARQLEKILALSGRSITLPEKEIMGGDTIPEDKLDDREMGHVGLELPSGPSEGEGLLSLFGNDHRPVSSKEDADIDAPWQKILGMPRRVLLPVAAVLLVVLALSAMGKFFWKQTPELSHDASEQRVPAEQPQIASPNRTLNTKNDSAPQQDKTPQPKPEPPDPTPNDQRDSTPQQTVVPIPPEPKSDAAAIEQQADALYNQKRYAEARPLFDEACASQRGYACNQLGYMYQQKLGVEQDYSRAVGLYTKACDAGYATGCYNLGYMYQNKEGVDQNYPRAVELYTKACDAPLATACNSLGYMYQYKLGVEQDYPRALELYTEACNSYYDASSCYNLGYMYEHGLGVKQDYPRALELFTKVCNAGIADGCNSLGVMYQSGLGIPKDYPKAFTLFTKACDVGNAAGCGGVGVSYRDGAGVNRDSEKAKQFFSKSCSMGEGRSCDLAKQVQ